MLHLPVKGSNITLKDSTISSEIDWVLLSWRVHKAVPIDVAIEKSFVRLNPSKVVCRVRALLFCIFGYI